MLHPSSCHLWTGLALHEQWLCDAKEGGEQGGEIHLNAEGDSINLLELG